MHCQEYVKHSDFRSAGYGYVLDQTRWIMRKALWLTLFVQLDLVRYSGRLVANFFKICADSPTQPDQPI